MVGTCSQLLGRKMGGCNVVNIGYRFISAGTDTLMADAPAMARSMPFPLSPYSHVCDLHEEGKWYIPLIVGVAIFVLFCLLVYALYRTTRPPVLVGVPPVDGAAAGGVGGGLGVPPVGGAAAGGGVGGEVQLPEVQAVRWTLVGQGEDVVR
ncbi:uncharacterized protein LOC113361888 [Papaver somniferum]|uniref:uncharacterized protein LOC113361888 n=1 Tax=Papaver somniferum TaxID=3469 RepID=UPI000E6FF88F|nr:uncharacterized protein LOC113361888 [Papaver somniferum]